MKRLVALTIVGLAASAALAQPYNVRGTFNGWGESQMNDDGDGSYSLTVGALNPGDRHNFKIAFNDWASSWPGSDSRTAVNAAGEITFHFIPGAIADGWFPPQDRVGYADPGMFGWEIQGAFNNWDENVDSAARQLSDMGGGLYSVDYTIAAPGTYDFKFRESFSWDISIGDNFGNSAANNQVTTTIANELVRFELDLPNGRWRTSTVPEPATVFGLTAGGLALLRVLRRRG